MPKHNVTYWFWMAADAALASYLFVDREYIKAALNLAAMRASFFAWRRGRGTAFPV
jgi:2-methylcitrate dehydratase PrpD